MKNRFKFNNIVWSSIKAIKILPNYLIISWILICLINSISFIFQMNFIEIFINDIEYYINGNIGIVKVCKSGSLLFLSIVITYVFSALSAWEDEVLEVTAVSKLNSEFHKKLCNIRVEYFNDIEFLNKIEKAKKGQLNTIYVGQVILFVLSWHIPYFIYLSIYLMHIRPIFIVILLLSLFPNALIYFLQTHYSYKHENIIAATNRKMQYFYSCFNEQNSFKELKLNSAFEFIKNKFAESIDNYNELTLKYEKKSIKLELINKIIITMGQVLIICILVYNVASGLISLGEFGAILASVSRIFTMTRSIVFSNIGYITKNSGAIAHYIEFMESLEYSEEKKHLPTNMEYIEFDNVSYCYPNSNEFAIKNVSLKIDKNDIIAVVGLNGSGKSTFAKLVLGLYKPTSGKIIYKGTVNEQGAYASALFQDYCKYSSSFENNIQISNIEPVQNKPQNHVDVGKLFPLESSNKWKYFIQKYGYKLFQSQLSILDKTLLGTEFGGIDLSGGQWQRIGLLRALYRDSNIVVLDEPTSAIDPIEENNMYKQFASILKEKTGIIITHRLGAATLAKRIIVFSNGTVVGDGSHNQLLKKCSIYKNLWEAQSSMF